MTQSKATARPWAVNGSLIVVDCYGKIIADTDISLQHPPKRYVERAEAQANAALIIQAVNAHDALVSALRDAQSWLNSSEVQYVISHKLGEQAALHKTLREVQAALRLAEGREG